MSQLSRRLLMTGATAAMVLGASSNTRPATRETAPDAGLHTRAARRGLFYGTAVDNGLLETDKSYMSHVPTECGVLVGEAAFKWADLHPAQDNYTFERADRLMAYAAKKSLKVRGHALLWHEANPAWLEQGLTTANGEALLTRHIATVAGRYRGHLIHWDVANEVLFPEDRRTLGLRDTLWLRALGPRYLDIAFHAAADADPGALRVLNEYGTDYAIPQDEAKRQAMLRLLEDLRARNVPIQAVGLQAHLDAGQVALDQGVLARFVGDIAALGLKVIVTELDVRDNNLPADVISRDDAVAAHAKAWLDAVLSNPSVLGVLSWGLSDRRSWLNEKFPRPDKLVQRALPLDVDLRRKRLWAAIGASLDAAPMRGAAL